jgi:branched-chain amino acid transport system permease protein
MQNSSSSGGAAGKSLTAYALRESVFAAAIAFGLFFLFVGLESTQNISNELIIVTHWVTLAVFVAIVGVGRFLLITVIRPWFDARKAERAKAPVVVKPVGFFRKNFNKIAVVFLFFYPMIIVFTPGLGLQSALKYVDNYGVQILIYVMLAWGLNIVVGLAGLLDLGYVAFYAVGAYSYALLSQQFGLSFWVLLPLSGIFAALWGVILGFPVLRLKGDYLAIVTLAFGEIIRLVLINWKDVTNGSAGISDIPKATLFGLKFDASSTGFAHIFHLPLSSAYYKIFLFYVILLLCLLTAYVTIQLRRMPIGRAWEALREDEIACRSLGINTTITKLTAFATGAMFAGFAGSFFSVRQGFVSPESFVFLESAIILAIVVLGGMGSLVGIAIAAVAMVGGTEMLRDLDFLKYFFGDNFTPELYRMLIFGLAMVIIMVWKPRGFVGSREPTAFLHERKNVSSSFTTEGHG